MSCTKLHFYSQNYMFIVISYCRTTLSSGLKGVVCDTKKKYAVLRYVITT
uniref:Uncharacterized protein n=1 Tax=Arundo donax TaxID=35708 RepID=A0A0A9H9W0_ARUDO